MRISWSLTRRIPTPDAACHPDRFRRGVGAIETRGYRVVVAPSADKRNGYLSGDEREMARDLNALFSDTSVAAISCALRKGLERAGSSLDEMTISLEMGSNAAIKDGVRRGLGASFVSRSTVERELAAGELVSVQVRGLVLTRHLYAVYHRRRPLSPAASAFLRFLKANPLKPDRR